MDWKARSVEMHRPDGIPDAVQQVKHGILQVLAQIKAIGHPIPGINEPTLRQYTHLGDGASKTDGRIYSEKLGPNEVDGNFSGMPDDRWAFTTKSANLQYGRCRIAGRGGAGAQRLGRCPGQGVPGYRGQAVEGGTCQSHPSQSSRSTPPAGWLPARSGTQLWNC